MRRKRALRRRIATSPTRTTTIPSPGGFGAARTVRRTKAAREAAETRGLRRFTTTSTFMSGVGPEGTDLTRRTLDARPSEFEAGVVDAMVVHPNERAVERLLDLLEVGERQVALV